MAARVFRFGVATWSSNAFWIQIKVACLQHYIAEEQSRAHPFKPILSRPFLRLVWFYSSLVLFESHSLSSYLTGRKQENRRSAKDPHLSLQLSENLSLQLSVLLVTQQRQGRACLVTAPVRKVPHTRRRVQTRETAEKNETKTTNSACVAVKSQPSHDG